MKAALVRRLANKLCKQESDINVLVNCSDEYLYPIFDRKISNEIELNKKTVFIEKPYSMKSTTNIVL